MLFLITENSVYDDNPHLKAIAEFKGVLEQEVRYIALVYDHQSPYRRLGLAERKDRALRSCGYYNKGTLTREGINIKNGKDFGVNRAIKTYQELQGWSPIEMLEGIDASLARYNKVLKGKGADIDEMLKISKMLPDVIKKRQEVLALAEEPMGHNKEEPSAKDTDEEDSTLDSLTAANG